MTYVAGNTEPDKQSDDVNGLLWDDYVDGSQTNSHKHRKKHENTSLFGLLGKPYGMTLVVIVDDYSTFVNNANLGWEDWRFKWVAAPRGTIWP